MLDGIKKHADKSVAQLLQELKKAADRHGHHTLHAEAIVQVIHKHAFREEGLDGIQTEALAAAALQHVEAAALLVMDDITARLDVLSKRLALTPE